MYLVELQGIEELHQWDKFRYLQINGLGSENLMQVDFYQESEEGVPEEAIAMAIEEGLNGIKRVQIPNQLLEQAKTIFLCLRNGEDTINIGSFPVIARPRPTNFSPSNTLSHINITSLYQKVSNLYVTPEMFGATGNGRDDDSGAIQAALNTGLPVYFYRRTYLCEYPLITKNLYNIHLKGCIEDMQNLEEYTKNLDKDRVDPLKDEQGRVNTHPGVSKTVLIFAPKEIYSNPIFNNCVTNYFITDDNFQSTSYTEGGNVILENLEFQGVVPSLQEGRDYGGGLCSFFNRDNLTVNNCNFKNYYTNGLTLHGLKNEATIKNSVFKDLGLMTKNGARNAISIDRTFWDRGNYGKLLDGNESLPLRVRVENCSFDSIGDECVCTTGIENVVIDNCTMNNVGHFIYETGHRSDRFPYCHTISNCIGNYIGAGIYDANADSSYNQQYSIKPGSVNITNCRFDNLAYYQENLMGNIRNALSVICAARALGYDNKEAENHPDVYIQDSYIRGYVNEKEEALDGPDVGQPFIGGESIYLINSRISFGKLRNASIFNFDKKMVIKNTNLYLPQKNKKVDGYFYLNNGSELKCQNSSFWVNLGTGPNSTSPIAYLNGEDVLISFDNCLLSNMGSYAYSFIKILNDTAIDRGSISFVNNSIDSKLKGLNFIHKDGTTSGKIRAIKYIGNYLRTDDTETKNQVLSNLTPEDVVWTVCSDNNYYGSVVEEVKK